MQRLSDEPAANTVAFPLVVDTDSHIASLYDMLSVDGPLWGHVIADANGRLRSMAAHAFPADLNVDDLIACAASVVESHNDQAR